MTGSLWQKGTGSERNGPADGKNGALQGACPLSPPHAGCTVLLALVLLTGGALAAPSERGTASRPAPQSKPAPADVPGVPAVGHILAIHVAADKIDRLEKLFGRGRVCLGSRGESGRMWKEKGSGWLIYADSLDAGPQGQIVNYVVMGDPACVVFPIETDPGKGKDKPKPPPTVSIRSRSMSLDGAILPAMTRTEVGRAIAAKRWPSKLEGEATVIRMGGLSRISKQVKVTDWEATLTFRNDRLVQIAIRSY